MKSVARFSFLLTALSVFSGCWKSDTTEAQKNEDSGSVKVINVLDAPYYKDAHIPGSINVSLDDLEKASKDWSKDSMLVTYCANYQCTSSLAAARKLKDLGFTNVKTYEAGMAAWAQAGLPVEGPAKEIYLTQPNKKHDDMENDGTTNAVSAEEDSEAKIEDLSTEVLSDLLNLQKKQEEEDKKDKEIEKTEEPKDKDSAQQVEDKKEEAITAVNEVESVHKADDEARDTKLAEAPVNAEEVKEEAATK